MKVFLDASFLYALVNKRDIFHEKASKMVEKLSSKECHVITTDYTFDEAVTVLSRKADKKTALRLGGMLLESNIILLNVNQKVFQTAWKYFHGEWNFSFTDCTILAFMRIFGINKIATFDQEFKKVKDIEVIS
ncbi:PIN domain-containing protein [archaeon]|nr:PIN domain-containing protein [archaeon]